MPAILAKKLGMTQRFLEDGRVERVTVLEAGPCPVTAIRTDDVDGYVAVQLGFGAVREKALTKAELGHLKKVDAPPVRTLVEFRDEAGELTVGETVTVEAFEVGQTVKVSGVSKGKGFQGTIKRHNFSAGPKSHGSHNVRAPGSIGASATPSRVFKGIRGPGHMGAKRVTQKRPRGRRADPRPEPDAPARLGPRAQGRHRGGAHRWLMRRSWAAPASSTLDADVLGAPFNGPLVHECVVAELAARRRGTHATKTRGMVRGGGAKPWRQKGTGRARAGSSRSPLWSGGGTVFGPSPRHYISRSTARPAAPRCAPRCRCTPSAARCSASTPAASTRRRPSRPPSLLDERALRLDAGRADRGGGERRQVVPQPRRASLVLERRERRRRRHRAARRRSSPRRRRSTR